MLRLRTAAADETHALATALAAMLERGDVLVLAGDLGAGKTAFTQGLARGLGIDERVTSPTFTIVREYAGGRLGLHHLDVYRLERLREVSDLGLGEMLDEDAVMVVEWGDAVLPALGDRYLAIRIELGDGDDDRTFEVVGHGASWQARRRAMADVLGRWADEEGPC